VGDADRLLDTRDAVHDHLETVTAAPPLPRRPSQSDGGKRSYLQKMTFAGFGLSMQRCDHGAAPHADLRHAASFFFS